ncbi:lysosomal-associated transmembrane protein 4a [Plakobranchus ocellatus]|uniref:Lysosomal-associated transmembrane protein 4a n=1 Tax=Plakobranchus ocellatus TaxID=259542 RepID=A0AAV4CXJ7_9GAST|nr:lysosomal-associated transmembrane protein 4a [Plakobranchus ocellatus]
MDKKRQNAISGIDPENFKCCICCDVKTGTVVYGSFNAAVQFIALCLLILASIRSDDGTVVMQTDQGDFFQNHPEAAREQQFGKALTYSFSIGFILICLIASVSLLYGVGKNRAAYLMPFFGLQVFDFCLTVVFAGFTYTTNIKQWIHEQRLVILTLLFIVVLLIILSIKAYLIRMVWLCYKYIQKHVASRGYSVDPDAEQMLLPPGEEVVIKVNPNNGI